MAGDNSSASALHSVYYSLVAAAIGAVGYPAVSVWWRYLAGYEPPDWARATLSNSLAAAILLAAAIFGSRLVSKAVRRKAPLEQQRLSDLSEDDYQHFPRDAVRIVLGSVYKVIDA